MQSLGIKKNRQISGLLLTLIASASMLGGCGDGIFLSQDSPTTTAAANTAGGVTPTPSPAPGVTPSPTPTPTPDRKSVV